VRECRGCQAKLPIWKLYPLRKILFCDSCYCEYLAIIDGCDLKHLIKRSEDETSSRGFGEDFSDAQQSFE